MSTELNAQEILFASPADDFIADGVCPQIPAEHPHTSEAYPGSCFATGTYSCAGSRPCLSPAQGPDVHSANPPGELGRDLLAFTRAT